MALILFPDGTIPNVRFSPDLILLTSGVQVLAREGRLDPGPYLLRHLSADWGDLDADDCRRNDIALKCGNEMLMSAFQVASDLRIWIITEQDRSVTTMLLPEEY